MYLSLPEFFEFHGLATNAPRVVKPFHAAILKALAQVITGTLPDGKRNLMILMPPRHGKTFLARDFVAYGLGCFPDSQFIYTSYSATRAEKETVAIRQAVQSEWFKQLFPAVELDKEAADRFTTTKGGQVFGVGVGGPITGEGAGVKRPEFGGAAVIDDGLKADDSQSAAALEHCRTWYTRTLKNRRNYDRTPIVLIQQRLNPDDLVGHILKTEAEDWHVLCFEGLREDGTALWEETCSAKTWLKLKEVDPFTFWSQGQQKPQIPGGNMIKREWWKYYHAATYNTHSLIFITADTALKAGDKNDRSSLQCWHATDEYLDLLEDETGRWEFPELLRHMAAFWKKWECFGCNTVYIEDKASGTPLGQMLAGQGVPCILWKPGDYDFPNDKVSRVKMSLWFIEGGRVRLPDDDVPWVQPFIEECSSFTGDDSVHDDRVDAMTIACSVWAWKGGGRDIRAAW